MQGITCCEATSVDNGTGTPEVQCPIPVTSEARMDVVVTAAAKAPDLHVRQCQLHQTSSRGMC